MATIEPTRAIVDEQEEYEGKIHPTEQAEIERPVRIHEDATVTGSVYGQEVELAAGATVEGSIMASNAIDLEGAAVHREVGTPGKIDADNTEIYGSVTGTNVQLTDCIVHGNVVGDDVTLENTVVVGIVTGERSLAVASSLCYTFKAHGETTLTDTQVLFPQAIVDGPLELATPVDIVGIELTEPESGEQATLTEADVLTQDGTEYLTLAPRLLNLDDVRTRLADLEAHLQELAAGSTTQADTTAFFDALDVDPPTPLD